MSGFMYAVVHTDDLELAKQYLVMDEGAVKKLVDQMEASGDAPEWNFFRLESVNPKDI